VSRSSTLRAAALHVLLIVVASAAYESLFVHHGIAWLFDEGWPLYAAKLLHEGGTLYADIFFPFPPGHLLPAWVAYALDPPGIILARIFYSAFTVALCVAVYFLGRRLTSARFALLAALLLAFAAPRSHLSHLLFGYRYLVFSVCALVAFAAYLQSRDRRAMVLAGFLTGVALYFRLTPAFAVGCGVGVAVMAADRSPRQWLRDWGLYAAGIMVVLVPMLIWFASTVGLGEVWRELVVRIIALQALQSMPIPPFVWPDGLDRQRIFQSFVPVQYWMFIALYAGYGIVLLARWIRCASRREPFVHALLLAVVIWGGIYLLRTLGRSDEHHLTSAIPPACLLLAHFVGLPFGSTHSRPSGARHAVAWGACAVVLGGWVFLQGSDLYLSAFRRGLYPLRTLQGEIKISSKRQAAALDLKISTIRESTQPGDIMLDLTNAPLLHVVTDRNGPGFIDVVTPGVFLNEAEQRELIGRMELRPPALVLWPDHHFDWMPSRSLGVTAPLVAQWVHAHYRPMGKRPLSKMLVPRDGAFATPPSEASSP